jgi:hypothetical protein
MTSTAPGIQHQIVGGRPRRAIKLAVCALIPISLVVITCLVSWLNGGISLQEAIAEADRFDPGWRFDDLEAARRPYPAPDKNGMDHALRVSAAMPKTAWPDWPFPEAAGDPARLQQLRIQLEESLRPERQVLPRLLSAEQERVLRIELKRAASAIELARQMPNYPSGRFPIK